jgi:hypothetical protein
MKIKRQRDKFDCGVAVCSMVTGLSFPQVRERLSHVKGYGCFMSDITKFLDGQGVKWKPAKTITKRCVLRLQNDGQSHFVLIWDGITFDPASGKSKTVPEHVKEIVSL